MGGEEGRWWSGSQDQDDYSHDSQMARAHLQAGQGSFQVETPTINTDQADLLTNSVIVYAIVYMHMYSYRYAGPDAWKSGLGSAFTM